MPPLKLRNAVAVEAVPAPLATMEDWTRFITASLKDGAKLMALFGEPRSGSVVRLHAIVSWPLTGYLQWYAAEAENEYPALTPINPQAHLFEREIYEQTGLKPAGHPQLKPVRFPGGDGFAVGDMDFLALEGLETHEVAVGPIHAGIIEPGHFRFLCHGETVYHLEISLGYQYRGIEAALKGGPHKRTRFLMETIAGDATIGHAWAYYSLMETLAWTEPTLRGQAIRALALELERLANHVGDLGALAGDVGFLPTMSFCGRLRGDFLNLTGLLCGSRFGRGLLAFGGTAFDLNQSLIAEIRARLDNIEPDLRRALHLLRHTTTVLDRFELTGIVPIQAALDLGLVGPALRACGHPWDCRMDFPLPGCPMVTNINPQISLVGDVRSRAMVRIREIRESLAFVRRLLAHLEKMPLGNTSLSPGLLQPQSMAVALLEGWRGAICHVAFTDENGRLADYKIIDPSFHNWAALAYAMRGQAISDFPLCNKSFNLSYCGYDL